MIKNAKRILAFTLLVCMLVAVLPFSAFADEAPADTNTITFDFTGVATSADEPVNLIKNEEAGTNWKYYYAPAKGTLQAFPGYAEYATTIEDYYYQEIINGNGLNKYWFAFKLSGIEAGMYNVDFSMIAQEVATSFNANVYIIPATGAPNNNSGITAKIKNGEILGSVNSSKESSVIKNVNIGGDDNGDYILMLDGVLNDAGHLKDCKIQLKTITFTKVQKTPPATTAPTLPDFNTPDEPADDAGSFPVVPVVIAAVAVVAVAAVVVIVISKKKKNSAE